MVFSVAATSNARRVPSFSLGKAIYIILCVIAFALMFLPVVFVAWVSVFQDKIVMFPPSGYSLVWFENAWTNEAFTSGFATSLQVGIIATLVGLGVGVPASLAIVRGRFPGRTFLNTFLLSPLIVPGVVAGTSLYIVFVQIEIITGVRIVSTLPGFILAHIVLTIPWTVRLVSANLVGVNRSVEEAAANLGASPLQVFRRITLPMIRPGIVAAGIFSFIVSFSDVEISLFLAGPGRTTLQIAMMQYLEWNFDPTIAAVSVTQIAIIGIGLAITNRFVKLSSVV